MKIIKTKSFELGTTSKGKEDSKKLALLIPGRLDTKDYCNFVSHLNYLAERGFYAVAFDAPGTWDSPGGTELFTTTNYIKAVHELIEYFANRPTLLLGHSRGATVAILASDNKAVFAIIPIAANFGAPTNPGAETLNTGFHKSHRDFPPGNIATKEQKEFMLPLNYWEDGKQYNIIKTIKNCTKPKLIIYPNRDEFTTVPEIEALYKDIPEPKMSKEIDSTHDYRKFPEAIKEVEKTIDEFLDKYNL